MRSSHTPAQRLALALSALGVMVVGVVAIAGLLIASEELGTHPGQRWAPAFHWLAFVVIVTLLGVGALLGLAVVPGPIVERGHRGLFSLASSLAVLALGFAVPTPLALFTWPLGALAAVVAFLLFRRAARLGRSPGAKS